MTNPRTLTIGEKQVIISQPYRPRFASELTGRADETGLITAAWIAGPDSLPLAPLLVGEPGVGKNRIVYELAQRTGKELFIFQGHEDVTAEDLASAVRFSDDADRKMDYVASPLVTAMLRGGICFIDEIAKIRPRALALLVSVLDERRYIDSTLLGERVFADEGFRFIAATNTADLEGNMMPEFLRSRLRPQIEVGYPTSEEIAQIVKSHHPDSRQPINSLIELFWRLWRERGVRTRDETPPTPRDAIYVFNLALSLADFDRRAGWNAIEKWRPGDETISVSSADGAAAIEERHLQRAFDELFGGQDGEA